MDRVVDVLVIGAGQAGLSMGYYLKKHGLSFLIVDKWKRVGDEWRKRYDSLVLFTPRNYSSLPGMAFPGDSNGLPDKNEVADYLQTYSQEFSLPILHGTEVVQLERYGDRFIADTSSGRIVANRIVVATGPFQKPFIPRLEGEASSDIFQIHSAAYRNPADLREGSVLVVGGGNTGIQLALELRETRKVYLSLGEDRKNLPLEFMGKSIFWWLEKLGILEANVTTQFGSWLSKMKDPVFGLGPVLAQAIRDQSITIVHKVTGCNSREVTFSDQASISVDNILWATGFSRDFSWIQIPNVLNEKGLPIHNRGVTQVPNLYFLGLPWQYRRGSALIGGVGRDAEYLLEQILT